MTPKKAFVLNIIIALIFAGAIILVSRLLQDSDHVQSVTYLILALWIIPSGMLTAAGIKKDKDEKK